MDSTRIVGEKIKSLRETKEISVAELAERSGLAEEQINRIENNVDLPSLAPLIKIARALGVRLGTFLDDQEEQEQSFVAKRVPKIQSAFQIMQWTYALTCATILCQNRKPTAIWNLSLLM